MGDRMAGVWAARPGGCAATGPTVVTDFDPAADFSVFRTFAFSGVADRGREVGPSDTSPLRNRVKEMIEFVMVLMAGRDQVDWKKLRQLVKRSRVRMATEEEVLEVTGYRIGTVSPFGIKNHVRVLLDASVLREEEVSLGSGIRNVAIIMKSRDVRKALGDVEIVEFGESS